MARYTAWKTVIGGVEKKYRSENGPTSVSALRALAAKHRKTHR